MSVDWDRLAAVARRDRADIEREAALAWLEREVFEVNREIEGYVSRYAVASPDELEGLIRAGAVEGHPAWEDCLGWRNLLDYRSSLEAELGTADA